MVKMLFPYRKLLWVALNSFGFAISFILDTLIESGLAGIYTSSLTRAVIQWLLTGLTIAGSQYLYFLVFPLNVSRVRWFFVTWITIFVLIVVQVNLFLIIVEIIPELISNGLSTTYLGGTIVINEVNGVQTFVVSSVMGITFGLINGLVLGILQAFQFTDPKVRLAWFKAVVISFSVGHFINSVLLAGLNEYFDIFPAGKYLYLWTLLLCILGLLYGLSTRKLIVIAHGER